MKVLVLALATWRLASLLAVETGPFDVFVRVRHLLGVRYDDYSVMYSANWIGKGVICIWCNSVWFGALWALLWFLFPWAWWLALPFALSTAAVIVERLVNGE